MSDSKQDPTDMRQYREQTNQRYLYMVVFTLVIGGSGLAGLIWGWQALLTSLPCLLGGAALIFIPWYVLTAIERWRKKVEQEDLEMLRQAAADEAKKV